MNALLRAEGLHKSFGGVRAVQNVSICVPENSIFALIGPNGAGKSTLLNLLSGIYQPDSGSLFFNEKDLIGLRAHQRARLGIARTFQKIRLFKQLTLLENVLAGFHIHQDTPLWKCLLLGNTGRFRDEARELLAFVGLG
ncbi:MAG: ATP-binding cassette domain-containing protein, partial [Pseudomonadota bacterium]|nr:ATP-binding cassette domain-containing protein [Pseudomonadota bacterium]